MTNLVQVFPDGEGPVSMTTFNGVVYIATSKGVYFINKEHELEALKLATPDTVVLRNTDTEHSEEELGIIVVVDPDGNVDIKTNRLAPSLDWMQKTIGGYIEPIRGLKWEDRETTVYVDEEGALKSLPHNPSASAFTQRNVWGTAIYLVGMDLD